MNIYCIDHENVVNGREMEFCEFGHDNFITALSEHGVVLENDFCCFDKGYAFVPPPDEFYLRGRETMPSVEELELINSTASELLTDWS